MIVDALWRYPVKSMQGERLTEAEVGERGIAGDRQWALVDVATGLALTARRQAELLYASARLVGPDEVEITGPDGTVLADDAALSAWLGKPVELRRARHDARGRYEIASDFEAEDTSEWIQWSGPKGSFHDSNRTMVSLASRASQGDWDERRFRMNVWLRPADGEAAPEPRAEAQWVDAQLRIGGAVLEVVKEVARCVITTRPQPGGIERDLDVLRTINATRDSNLGISLLVTTPGRIAVGDEVRPA